MSASGKISLFSSGVTLEFILWAVVVGILLICLCLYQSTSPYNPKKGRNKDK